MQRRTLTISPMAKDSGRWAARHGRGAAPAAPLKVRQTWCLAKLPLSTWPCRHMRCNKRSCGAMERLDSRTNVMCSPLQAVLNLDEVLRDVLAWDMYAVLASEASGGWGRAAQQAPLGFSGIEAYVEAS